MTRFLSNTFDNLFDLSYNRTTSQAWGFYFFYLAVGLAVTFIATVFFGPAVPVEELDSLKLEARVIGKVPNTIAIISEQTLFFQKVISMTFSAVLAILVAYKKKIIEKYSTVFIIAGSTIFGFVLGLPISVAFAAWLTTRKNIDTIDAGKESE